MTQRVLIAGDGSFDQSLRATLEHRRFEVAFEDDLRRVCERLVESDFDLLILGSTEVARAVELLKTIRATPQLRNALVLVTAEWGTGQATLALANGADAFEPKPIEAARLVAAVEKLLRPRMVMTARASTAEGEADE